MSSKYPRKTVPQRVDRSQSRTPAAIGLAIERYSRSSIGPEPFYICHPVTCEGKFYACQSDAELLPGALHELKKNCGKCSEFTLRICGCYYDNFADSLLLVDHVGQRLPTALVIPICRFHVSRFRSDSALSISPSFHFASSSSLARTTR